MLELLFILALVAIVVVFLGLVSVVFHAVGEVLGAVFAFLGWLIALPFTILGWIVSAIGFLLSGPILLLFLLAPLVLVTVAFGVVFLVAMAPVFLLAGGLWLVLRALFGGARRARPA
jgi:hypothetical protein